MRLLRYMLFFSFLLGAFISGFLFFLTQWPVVDFSVLERYNPSKGSVLLDDEGEEIARFQYDRREIVHLEAIPRSLVNAFLAAEDHSFFTHSGVSFRAIIRSFLVNIFHGRVVQGASTITQQLVKLLYTDSQRTFARKIKEQFLALLVEKQFSKEQILETYLNHIYFGCGIYGVEAAAQRFWGISVRDIRPDQAALLAGIIRSPAKYCPLLAPEKSVEIRNSVLKSMFSLGFISQEVYQEGSARELSLSQSMSSHIIAPYFKEHVRLFLENLLGKKELYTGGYRIQSTLNRSVQQAAEESFYESIRTLKEKVNPVINGALITLDVQTGEIKALIGGINFSESSFNRATQARRQMGSTFKPLVYLAAIESGMGMDQVAIDEPITMVDAVGNIWKPKNVTNNFQGPMTLAHALSRSNNMIAIKTFLTVGYEKVARLANLAGITGHIKAYPSTALGTTEATVEEVAGYINIFANNGVYLKPHALRWIKNSWGDKIWRYKPEARKVISPRIIGQVTRVLTLALEQNKARQAVQDRLLSQAFGKSGTTNDSRTCWFAGSTPHYTTAVYIGGDRNEQLGESVLSYNTTYPLWHNYMKRVDKTRKMFGYDSDLSLEFINRYTGEKSGSDDPLALSILLDPAITYPRYAPNPLPQESLLEKQSEQSDQNAEAEEHNAGEHNE